MNLAPRVETAELPDSDLDNLAGGLAGGGSGGLHLETPVAEVCVDVLAVASAETLAARTGVHTTAL